MRTAEIRGEIEKLRDVEKNAFRGRHARFEFYNYLDRVVRFYWRCRDAGKPKTARKMIAAEYGLKDRKGKRLLHVIVEATSQQPAQTRNRWVQALQFAAKHRQQVEKDGFSKFVKDYGGIAGCADKAANPRIPQPRGRKKRKW